MNGLIILIVKKQVFGLCQIIKLELLALDKIISYLVNSVGLIL